MMLTEKNFDVVGKMEAVSLEEMSAVSLMNRVDTKYLTTAAKLGLVLEDAYRAGYRICEIEGQRRLSYASVYYDTPDLQMFTAHRNGKKTRQKVRVRTYLVDGQIVYADQAQNMLDKAKENNVKLMIGQCVRYFPQYVALKNIIDSKKYASCIHIPNRCSFTV